MLLNWFLRLFINVWLGLFLALQVIRSLDIMLRAPSMWTGMSDVLDAFSPYNGVHFTAMVIAASPALGAFLWLERRKRSA
jgi:hypothetical protein